MKAVSHQNHGSLCYISQFVNSAVFRIHIQVQFALCEDLIIPGLLPRWWFGLQYDSLLVKSPTNSESPTPCRGYLKI